MMMKDIEEISVSLREIKLIYKIILNSYCQQVQITSISKDMRLTIIWELVCNFFYTICVLKWKQLRFLLFSEVRMKTSSECYFIGDISTRYLLNIVLRLCPKIILYSVWQKIQKWKHL